MVLACRTTPLPHIDLRIITPGSAVTGSKVGVENRQKEGISMKEVLDVTRSLSEPLEIVRDKVYFTSFSPSVSEAILFISTYDAEDPKSPAIEKHGYQRPPTPARFADI